MRAHFGDPLRTLYHFNDSQIKLPQVDLRSNELSDIFEGGNTQREVGMWGLCAFHSSTTQNRLW